VRGLATAAVRISFAFNRELHCLGIYWFFSQHLYHNPRRPGMACTATSSANRITLLTAQFAVRVADAHPDFDSIDFSQAQWVNSGGAL